MSLKRFLGLGRALSPTQEFDRNVRDALDGLVSGPNTSAGETVTASSALQLTAVYGCVRILSEVIGSLPVDTFIRWDGARRPYRPTPPWLEEMPDGALWPRSVVLGQAMVSLLLSGNAFVRLIWDGPKVVYLDVIDPTGIVIEAEGPRRFYRVGSAVYSDTELVHIPGLMLPGSDIGLSPISYCAETMGLGLAAQRYGGAFFGNGATPGGLIEVEGALTETGKKSIKAAWGAMYGGAGNANKVAVLTEGAKFSKLSVPPDEAQFLETRAFQVADIARIYGVPNHLLNDSTGSTSWGSGLEEQNTALSQFVLRPWVVRLEQALTKALRMEGASARAFVRFNLDGTLRGDLATRMTTYVQGVTAGIYTKDEVRALEDMPPLPDGLGAAKPPAPPPPPPGSPTPAQSEPPPEEGP